MNFSKVKSLRIPEGNVIQISVGDIHIWNKNITVIFKDEEYEGSHSDETTVVKYNEKLNASLIPVWTREGYDFDGWNGDVTQKITKTTIFTAKWKLSIKTVSIKYYKNY